MIILLLLFTVYKRSSVKPETFCRYKRGEKRIVCENIYFLLKKSIFRIVEQR